jgi:hypothetical protein
MIELAGVSSEAASRSSMGIRPTRRPSSTTAMSALVSSRLEVRSRLRTSATESPGLVVSTRNEAYARALPPVGSDRGKDTVMAAASPPDVNDAIHGPSMASGVGVVTGVTRLPSGRDPSTAPGHLASSAMVARRP